jgi:hypothetical protein
MRVVKQEAPTGGVDGYAPGGEAGQLSWGRGLREKQVVLPSGTPVCGGDHGPSSRSRYSARSAPLPPPSEV